MLVKGTAAFLACGLLFAPRANAVWLPPTAESKNVEKEEVSLCTLCKLIVENVDNVMASDEDDTLCESLDKKLKKKCKKLLKKIVFESDGKVNANDICKEVDACPDEDDHGDDDDDDHKSDDALLSTSFRPGAVKTRKHVEPASIKLSYPPAHRTDDVNGGAVKLFHPAQVHDAANADKPARSTSTMQPKQHPAAARTAMWTEIIIVEVPSQSVHNDVNEEEYYVMEEYEQEQAAYLDAFYHTNTLASFAIILVLCYYIFGASNEPEYVIMAAHDDDLPAYEAHMSKSAGKSGASPIAL